MLVPLCRLGRRSAIRFPQLRTHMNHGGGGDSRKLPLDPPGPRSAGVEIGLDSATSVHNILRLLESSHGPYYSHAHSTSWHPQGQIWEYQYSDDNDEDGWTIQAQPEQPTNKVFHQPVRLLNLCFSDPRTALAKVLGCDGRLRFLSILQWEDSKPLNDGWILLREVIGAKQEERSHHFYHTQSLASLQKALETYFSIEHGGGLEDQKAAQQLFHPDSTLLAVGSDPQGTQNNEWAAPVGSLLTISMEIYWNGVLHQTAHNVDATRHDSIVAIDILPCGTVAAATVRVGNGAQTRVFEDHLLLGKRSSSNWQILSKTFSPQAWPH